MKQGTRDSEYVLALDGGGTKTEVALATRAGAVELCPLGAGINPMDNPNWRTEFERALTTPPADGQRIAQAVLGMPGYGEVATITAAQKQAVQALCAFPAAIVNDVELAFDGAFLDAAGILVLSGTGSMAIGRNSDKRQIRVGGYGDAFGDEGSAYWIGRETIARVSWILDGRLRQTSDSAAFVDAILDAAGIEPTRDPLKLMDWYYHLQHPRSAVAALTLTVDRLARKKNPAAIAILSQAAEHLSRHIDAAEHQLTDTETLPWSFGGSVFNSDTLKAALIDRQGRAPTLPQLPPLGGGLWAAARRAGWAVDLDWSREVAHGIRRQSTA